MPRPKKANDGILKVLEVAHASLVVADEIIEPVSAMRIKQAIDRHPDLHNLLGPLVQEASEERRKRLTARISIQTAMSMLRNKKE